VDYYFTQKHPIQIDSRKKNLTWN